MTLNIEAFFTERSHLIGDAVSFHLLLEGLIERLLVHTLQEPSALQLDRMRFSQKLALCCALGLISRPIYDVAKQLNKLRNRYAHELDYSPSFEGLHDLVVKAARAGVDFSDGVEASVQFARSLNYDSSMLLNTLFRNTFFHVAYEQEEAFWDGLV